MRQGSRVGRSMCSYFVPLLPGFQERLQKISKPAGSAHGSLSVQRESEVRGLFRCDPMPAASVPFGRGEVDRKPPHRCEPKRFQLADEVERVALNEVS